MNEYDEQLRILEREHEVLQFTEFSSETAWTIGTSLVERARAEKKAITIDIARNGHQLFHYAFDGTRPDNDEWVRRKNNTVNRFYKSSLYMGIFLKNSGMTMEDRYFVSQRDYVINGGAFPIIIRNTGVVGTITVSGMTQEEDHRWAVDAIKAYLSVRS